MDSVYIEDSVAQPRQSLSIVFSCSCRGVPENLLAVSMFLPFFPVSWCSSLSRRRQAIAREAGSCPAPRAKRSYIRCPGRPLRVTLAWRQLSWCVHFFRLVPLSLRKHLAPALVTPAQDAASAMQLVAAVIVLSLLSDRRRCISSPPCLQPCRLVSFEEGELPPLYMNDAQAGAKPKWTLCQGLGPKGLEVDKSKSGRCDRCFAGLRRLMPWHQLRSVPCM